MTAARPVRIGLTGPIGCGKSTVARWLGERGAVVIDADAVAREVTAPGQPGHDAVLARFGDPVRAADGTLDRAALARIVFSDPAALRDLEAIVHPLVRPRILAAIDAAAGTEAPAVAIEAIKLVEGGLAELCDVVWWVTCHEPARPPDRRGAWSRPTPTAGSRPRPGWPTASGPRGTTWSRSTRRAASPRPKRGSPRCGMGSSRITEARRSSYL